MLLFEEFVESALYEYAAPKTKIQELLTCAIFDAVINGGKDFDTLNMTLGDTLQELSDAVGIERYAFEDVLNSASWSKSFKSQTETLNNFLSNPDCAFDDKKMTYAFVHHDTSVSVFNGKVSTYKPIADLVDAGRRMHKYKSKDSYMKADIYMIRESYMDEFSNIKIEENDVDIWNDGIRSGNFIGISLKKLGATIEDPKIYNFDEFAGSEEDGDVKLTFDPFSGTQYENKVIGDTGNVSYWFTFSGKVNSDEVHDYKINIRSNKLGIASMPMRPYEAFTVSPVIELSVSGSYAQAGKVSDPIKKYLKENGLEPPALDPKYATGAEVEAYIDEINSISAKHGIELNKPEKQSIDLLDDLAKNADYLSDYFYGIQQRLKATDEFMNAEKELTKSKLISDEIDTDYLVKLVSAVKWKFIVVKSLVLIHGIFNIVDNRDKPMLSTFIEIAKAAKGINNAIDVKPHLPYLMIGI